jgi:diacylglycerol kinase family enzyme
MFHEYPKEKAEIKRIFLFYNKKAFYNRNSNSSRFIQLMRKFEEVKIIPEKIFVLPDHKIDLELKDGDALLIFGGDGTIHRVLTEIFKNLKENGENFPKILVGHLRGGTMNTIATCLQIPKIENILLKIKESKKIDVIPRNPIEIKTEKDVFYGFLFGAITPFNFLEKYYAGKILGPIRGAETLLIGLSEILKKEEKREILKKQKCKIKVVFYEEIPHLETEGEFLLIGASTIHSFGLNFSNFPKAPKCNDSFNFIAYSDSLLKLAIYLPLIYFGKLPKDSFNEITRESEIESQEKIGFTIDGDLYSARKITLRPAPKVFFVT